MQLVYNNFQVCSEKHFVKVFPCFSEYYLVKNVLCSGFEPIKKKITSNSEKQRISSSRIKSKIRDLALCNDFEFFYTQTISTKYNRYNLDEFKNLILRKFKAYKRINHDFKYLVIFEKHKDSAFHLHGLISGVGIDLHKNSNGYDTLEFFADIGFNSISKIIDKNKIANYILKYISKDICKSLSGVSYFHSKGLNLPFKEEIYIDDFSSLSLVYENDFVKKYKRKEDLNE